jgi:hypothetical protein
VEAKKLINEADAIIITINVVAIQNGPYKSGLSLITSLKGGLKVIADTTLYFIYYSYI